MGRTMYNRHELHRICARCKSYKCRVVSPTKFYIDGMLVTLSNGMKTTKYHCEECDFVWEEAD